MTHSLDDALVEKVARAISSVCFATEWDDLAEDTRAAFFPYARSAARAALEAAGVAELREEIERLRDAASALVDKLDECAPAVANLCAMQFVRSGVGYTGPSYGEALETLRVTLKPRQNEEEGE